MASGGPGATKAAGLVFAATMLVRAPVYVFQGVAAALLPNLTRLNATNGVERLGREVMGTARLLLGAAVGVIAICSLGGPLGMRPVEYFADCGWDFDTHGVRDSPIQRQLERERREGAGGRILIGVMLAVLALTVSIASDKGVVWYGGIIGGLALAFSGWRRRG